MAALVLERVYQPVDGESVGEGGDRRVERRRMGEAASADLAARLGQRAHRAGWSDPRQRARAGFAHQLVARRRRAELAALRQRAPGRADRAAVHAVENAVKCAEQKI